MIFLSSSILPPTSFEQDLVFSYKSFISLSYPLIGANISSIILLFSLKTFYLIFGPASGPVAP
jgi:hypothetical protein